MSTRAVFGFTEGPVSNLVKYTVNNLICNRPGESFPEYFWRLIWYQEELVVSGMNYIKKPTIPETLISSRSTSINMVPFVEFSFTKS